MIALALLATLVALAHAAAVGPDLAFSMRFAGRVSLDPATGSFALSAKGSSQVNLKSGV